MNRSIVVSLLLIGLAVGGLGQTRHPVIKSLILPGWGERSLDARNRGLLFTGTEVALWSLAGLSQLSASHADRDIRYLAAEYAGVSDVDSKSDSFLDQVAQYSSMGEYNAEMLRNRRPERVYSPELGQDWDWESTERQSDFKSRKLERYQWRQRISYALGAVALNHMVSAMDALYLERTQASLNLSPTPDLQGAVLNLTLNF